MPNARTKRASTEDADNGAARYNSNVGGRQDPTALTTQQLLRENFWLRELLEARIEGVEQRIEQGDRAVALLQAFADRTPTTMDVQHEVVALREVMTEKFGGVANQLFERQKQREQMTHDSAKAVEAAFLASDKAITKAEGALTKQIDEQSKRIDSVAGNSNEKIDDLKERLTVIESRTQGITQQKAESGVATTQHASQVAVVAAIIFGSLGFLVGAGSLAVSMVKTSAPATVYLPAPSR